MKINNIQHNNNRQSLTKLFLNKLESKKQKGKEKK